MSIATAVAADVAWGSQDCESVTGSTVQVPVSSRLVGRRRCSFTGDNIEAEICAGFAGPVGLIRVAESRPRLV